jgi:hypothetical protein
MVEGNANDLVKRLRSRERGSHWVALLEEAADAIDQLRKDLDLNKRGWSNEIHLLQRAQDERDAVIAGRDLEHVGWINDAGAYLWLNHPAVRGLVLDDHPGWIRPLFVRKAS